MEKVHYIFDLAQICCQPYRWATQQHPQHCFLKKELGGCGFVRSKTPKPMVKD